MTGKSLPRLRRLEQILAISGIRVVALDHRGEPAKPFGVGAALDRGGRQYPAHVEILQWRPGVYWWGDHDFGVHCLPPEFVWDDVEPWVAVFGPGLVDRDRPDDERFPTQPYRRGRASFGSFRHAWRREQGFYPPKGFDRSAALKGGYHPDVLGISHAFLSTLPPELWPDGTAEQHRDTG